MKVRSLTCVVFSIEIITLVTSYCKSMKEERSLMCGDFNIEIVLQGISYCQSMKY